MGASKEKWQSTVELTVAHHCDCTCGEGDLREYSVAVTPNNATKSATASVLRLDEHELVGLVGAVARHFSPGMEDSEALFGPWGKIGSQINRRKFQSLPARRRRPIKPATISKMARRAECVGSAAPR
jgi:hypothetical protein